MQTLLVRFWQLAALAALIAAWACGDAQALLSGKRAGLRAAVEYCDCLKRPGEFSVQVSAPEKRTLACREATRSGMQALFKRTKGDPREAQNFSDQYHQKSRACEQELRATEPKAKEQALQPVGVPRT